MSNLKGLGDAAKLAVQLIDVISHASGNDKPDKKTVEVIAQKAGEPRCKTCGDTLQVGVPGHEVPCPKCVVEQPPCPTCKGKGSVGAKGHEVKCPVCQRGEE